jgi:hypothetical protein
MGFTARVVPGPIPSTGNGTGGRWASLKVWSLSSVRCKHNTEREEPGTTSLWASPQLWSPAPSQVHGGRDTMGVGITVWVVPVTPCSGSIAGKGKDRGQPDTGLHSLIGPRPLLQARGKGTGTLWASSASWSLSPMHREDSTEREAGDSLAMGFNHSMVPGPTFRHGSPGQRPCGLHVKHGPSDPRALQV